MTWRELTTAKKSFSLVFILVSCTSINTHHRRNAGGKGRFLIKSRVGVSAWPIKFHRWIKSDWLFKLYTEKSCWHERTVISDRPCHFKNRACYSSFLIFSSCIGRSWEVSFHVAHTHTHRDREREIATSQKWYMLQEGNIFFSMVDSGRSRQFTGYMMPASS